MGCFISCLCLIIAWITFQFISNLQCDRNTIHKNLVFSLLVAEMVFMLGIGQAQQPLLCSVVAGVLHFFFLSSFAWMCLEGVQLYVMLIEVFEAERSRKLWYYLSGYGIPAIIVIVSAAVEPSGYGTPSYCWLSTKGGFIWAFVGPVIVVLVLNSVMLCVAIYMMCKHARATAAWKMKQKTRSENVSNGSEETCGLRVVDHGHVSAADTQRHVHISWIKGAVVLVVLLGLTWTLGLLYVNQSTVVMAYLFTIVNSLQGLFIFLFHCVYNDKVQKEYKKIVRRTRWLPECFRVKYGGARSSTYTPNQSTTSANALQRLISSRFRKRSSTSSLQKSAFPTTPGKWQYQDMTQKRRSELTTLERSSQPDSSCGPDSAFYSQITDDPNAYLEPSKCAHAPPPRAYYDDDDVADFSVMEGSVCDTDYFDRMCTPTSRAAASGAAPGSTATIDVDKYKIKPAQRVMLPPQQRAPGHMGGRRLSAILQEGDLDEFEVSELDDPERVYHVLEGHSDDVIDALSEGSSDDSIKKRPLSTDSGNMSPSMNDLDKLNLSLSSQEDLNMNTPNIQCSQSSGPRQHDYGDGARANVSGPSSSQNSSGHSLRYGPAPTAVAGLDEDEEEEEGSHYSTIPDYDYAVDKLKIALARNNDGLVSVTHGGYRAQPRISRDTERALQQHDMRLSSTDC